MRQRLVIFATVSAVLVAVALLWPTAGYELERVHPRLRELAVPYQSVKTIYFLDGGSIGIRITDRDLRQLELALPVSSERGRSYPQLFIGAMPSRMTNAVEVTFSDDTRRMLVSLLEQQGTPGDDSAIALVSLRGAPRDHARLYGQTVVSVLKRIVP